MIRKLIACFKGATAIEYALIAALIAVVIILSLDLSGTRLQTTYSSISSSLSGAGL